MTTRRIFTDDLIHRLDATGDDPSHVCDIRKALHSRAESAGVNPHWVAGPSDVDDVLREEIEQSYESLYINVLTSSATSSARVERVVKPHRSDRLGLSSRQGRFARWVGWAGAIAVATVVAITSHQPGNGAPEQAYTTRPGERLRVTLADSSQVVLAPQSKLVVPSGYPTQHRTLRLAGEALFDVRHTAVPFVLETNRVAIKVLGTRFDVRAYPGESHFHVAVVTGKVAVSAITGSPSSSTTLVSGTVGTFSDSTRPTVNASDMSSYTDWVDGRLVFRDAPVPAMLQVVGKWYGVEFQLHDSVVARRHVTTTLKLGESEKTMAAIRQLLGVSMTVDGKTVILRPSVLGPYRNAPRPRWERRSIPNSMEVGK